MDEKQVYNDRGTVHILSADSFAAVNGDGSWRDWTYLDSNEDWVVNDKDGPSKAGLPLGLRLRQRAMRYKPRSLPED